MPTRYPNEQMHRIKYTKLPPEQIVSKLSVAGATVSGRVVFEGGRPPAGAASLLRVVLPAVNRLLVPGLLPNQRSAAPDDEGRFGFTGITGRVLVDATPPPGWVMKSVVVEGQSVTDTPLDVGRVPRCRTSWSR
jgi:hypothetical protein